jgi:carbon-monoxide dehydrogenase small subunit
VQELSLRLVVNGEPREARVEPRKLLADVLREDLKLTGTHLACEHGMCGACTILVDDQPVLSCLMFGLQAEGRRVTTIEGLGSPGAPHPLQESFARHHALQCGFCTPGMILAAAALLDRNPSPTESQVRQELCGNICRCTGYQKIVEAVLACAVRPEAGSDTGP